MCGQGTTQPPPNCVVVFDASFPLPVGLSIRGDHKVNIGWQERVAAMVPLPRPQVHPKTRNPAPSCCSVCHTNGEVVTGLDHPPAPIMNSESNRTKCSIIRKNTYPLFPGIPPAAPLPYSLSQVAVYYQDDDDRKKLDEGKEHPLPRKKRPFGKANPHKLPEDDDKEKQKTGNP